VSSWLLRSSKYPCDNLPRRTSWTVSRGVRTVLGMDAAQHEITIHDGFADGGGDEWPAETIDLSGCICLPPDPGDAVRAVARLVCGPSLVSRYDGQADSVITICVEADDGNNSRAEYRVDGLRLSGPV